MSDVLCDFCAREWTEAVPMVEGHRGSVICGACLRVAYAAVAGDDAPDPGAARACRMCLEARSDPAWESPLEPGAVICRRCVKLAARALERDPDAGWTRPG